MRNPRDDPPEHSAEVAVAAPDNPSDQQKARIDHMTSADGFAKTAGLGGAIPSTPS
jgi:hypothetical protein